MNGRRLDSCMDKICRNCEHFSGDRKLKRFLGSPTVDVTYRKENICVKTGHSQPSGDCTCNCSSFKVWYALQNEIEKNKEEKEHKREIEREKQRQVHERYERGGESQVEEHHYESKPVSDVKVEMMAGQMKQTIHEGRVSDVQNMKKLRAVPIIFSVLGTLMLVLGIVFKVLANKVAESNANSSSYYAKQNQSNAATTSTLGTVFIVISIICIIVPWLIWTYKYLKVKKAAEEI